MGRRRRDAVASDRLARELPTVWRYALAMLDDEADAREATRAVFASLDPALLTADDDSLTRLLLSRTRRLLEHRDGGPGASTDEPTSPEEPGSADEAASTVPAPAGDASGPQQLAAELRRLSPPEREAVVLRDVLGVGAVEATAVCDTSPEELRTRRHRGHRALVSALLRTDG